MAKSNGSVSLPVLATMPSEFTGLSFPLCEVEKALIVPLPVLSVNTSRVLLTIQQVAACPVISTVSRVDKLPSSPISLRMLPFQLKRRRPPGGQKTVKGKSEWNWIGSVGDRGMLFRETFYIDLEYQQFAMLTDSAFLSVITRKSPLGV